MSSNQSGASRPTRSRADSSRGISVHFSTTSSGTARGVQSSSGVTAFQSDRGDQVELTLETYLPPQFHDDFMDSLQYGYGNPAFNLAMLEFILFSALVQSGESNSGNPRAAPHALEMLPKVVIDLSESAEDRMCTVCQDSMDAVAVQMPCSHRFHKECLEPWFEQRNSCPTCRCEIESDDADYNYDNSDRIKEIPGRVPMAPPPAAAASSSSSAPSAAAAPTSGVSSRTRRPRVSTPAATGVSLLTPRPVPVSPIITRRRRHASNTIASSAVRDDFTDEIREPSRGGPRPVFRRTGSVVTSTSAIPADAAPSTSTQSSLRHPPSDPCAAPRSNHLEAVQESVAPAAATPKRKTRKSQAAQPRTISTRSQPAVEPSVDEAPITRASKRSRQN